VSTLIKLITLLNLITVLSLITYGDQFELQRSF